MTNALSAMEYPHWLMVAGAVLVVFGFIGLVFRKNRNRSGQQSSWAKESTPTERLEAMREAASASEQRKAKGK